MTRKKRNFATEFFNNKRTQLSEFISWFPYPALISYCLAIIFIGHFLLGLNPRLGSPANTIHLKSVSQPEGAIWISLSLKDSDLIITTAEKDILKAPLSDLETNTIADLTKYLEKKTKEAILSSILSKTSNQIESIVVLAIDQSIQFKHLKPVIGSIAKAGISKYAFETVQSSHLSL